MRQLLDEQIQENLGMAMMYTLCEALREYLVENNREGNVRLLRVITVAGGGGVMTDIVRVALLVAWAGRI